MFTVTVLTLTLAQLPPPAQPLQPPSTFPARAVPTATVDPLADYKAAMKAVEAGQTVLVVVGDAGLVDKPAYPVHRVAELPGREAGVWACFLVEGKPTMARYIKSEEAGLPLSVSSPVATQSQPVQTVLPRLFDPPFIPPQPVRSLVLPAVQSYMPLSGSS